MTDIPCWIVELEGPAGPLAMEVPTFGDAAVAERRALATAWALRVGDVDEVTVIRSYRREENPS